MDTFVSGALVPHIRTGDDDTQSRVRKPADTNALGSTPPERKPLASQTDTGRRKQSSLSGTDQPSSRRRVRVAEGIYKDRHGFAATVKTNGVQREIRFPRGTPLKTIRARRDELRVSLRLNHRRQSGSFADDAGRYLDQVRTTLTSFSDRQRHLQAWGAHSRFPGHALTPTGVMAIRCKQFHLPDL